MNTIPTKLEPLEIPNLNNPINTTKSDRTSNNKSLVTKKVIDDGDISKNPMSIESACVFDTVNLSIFNTYVKKCSAVMWVPIESNSSNMPQIYEEELDIEDNYYRISTRDGSEKLKKFYQKSYSHFIFCHKDRDSVSAAYIDLQFSKMKYITNLDTTIGPYYGIRIIKNDKFEDIVNYDEEKAVKLYEVMTNYCVLSQFSNYYTQIDGLGAGKFAKVFQVKRNKDDQQYAVKVYDTKKLHDNEQTYWVLYEITILRQLNNPHNDHVLKLKQLYEGRKYIYCVNDLYSGGELTDTLVNKKGLSELEAVMILQNILFGLEYLESLDIVHRDIKPPNIILRKPDDIFDVVICDLGFAIYTNDVSLKNTKQPFCVGTPGYMAPEMLHGQHYDCKADIFSAGVVLYLMLHYKSPFKSNDKEIVMKLNKECNVDFDFNNWKGYDYSYTEEQLHQLKKMMAKNPEDRYTAGQCLAHPAFLIIAKYKHIYMEMEQKTKDEAERLEKLYQKRHDDQSFVELKSFHQAIGVPENTKLAEDIPDNIKDFASPNQSPKLNKKRQKEKEERKLEAIGEDIEEQFSPKKLNRKTITQVPMGKATDTPNPYQDEEEFSPTHSPLKSPGKHPFRERAQTISVLGEIIHIEKLDADENALKKIQENSDDDDDSDDDGKPDTIEGVNQINCMKPLNTRVKKGSMIDARGIKDGDNMIRDSMLPQCGVSEREINDLSTNENDDIKPRKVLGGQSFPQKKGSQLSGISSNQSIDSKFGSKTDTSSNGRSSMQTSVNSQDSIGTKKKSILGRLVKRVSNFSSMFKSKKSIVNEFVNPDGQEGEMNKDVIESNEIKEEEEEEDEDEEEGSPGLEKSPRKNKGDNK